MKEFKHVHYFPVDEYMMGMARNSDLVEVYHSRPQLQSSRSVTRKDCSTMPTNTIGRLERSMISKRKKPLSSTSSSRKCTAIMLGKRRRLHAGNVPE